MPAKRGTPIVVVLLALGVVVLLVAKPWGSDPVRPGMAPSPAAVAATETAGVRPPTPAPTPRPLPSPDIGPAAPVGDYSIEFGADTAIAHCEYGRAVRGRRHLASIEVQPPVVLVHYPESNVRNIRSVGWRFELQVNRQQSMFDRDWETVARSRMQLTAAIDDRPTSFTPLTIVYDARGHDQTAVFQARVIVEWFTRNLESAGTFEVGANRYLEANDEFTGSWPAYCSGVRAAVR